MSSGAPSRALMPLSHNGMQFSIVELFNDLKPHATHNVKESNDLMSSVSGMMSLNGRRDINQRIAQVDLARRVVAGRCEELMDLLADHLSRNPRGTDMGVHHMIKAALVDFLTESLNFESRLLEACHEANDNIAAADDAIRRLGTELHQIDSMLTRSRAVVMKARIGFAFHRTEKVKASFREALRVYGDTIKAQRKRCEAVQRHLNERRDANMASNLDALQKTALTRTEGTIVQAEEQLGAFFRQLG